MHLGSCTNTNTHFTLSKENFLFFCGDCLANNTSTVCQTHPITKGEKICYFTMTRFGLCLNKCIVCFRYEINRVYETSIRSKFGALLVGEELAVAANASVSNQNQH